ncbi:MAG: alpha-2-macroglobulin family protein, partial [Brevundimonas sp.]
SGPEPKACIEMTRPLDASKSYADFVLVSPDPGVTPAVSVKGAELCVAGLGFTDRRVTLLKGLPGQGGDQLAANADVDFTFGERLPYVGFAGDGVILPREESDGVGIETVNVSRLAVEVWRVPDRNLVRMSITKTEPSGEGQYFGNYGEDYAGQEGQKVWSGMVPVKGEAGQRAVTVFPLGAVLKEMKPGGYVIHARDASGARGLKAAQAEDGEEGGDEGEGQAAQARRWVIFTDMALATYSGSDGVDVVVRSLKTAKILNNIKVSLVAANGEALANAMSDASGRVRFAKPLLEGREGMRAKMLMAYGPLGDLAVLDLERSPLDLSRQGVGGRNDPNALSTDGRSANAVVDSYVYADRGVYRPGETVHVVALVRDRDAVAASRKGSLVVSRPSGTEFKRIAFDKSAGGYVTSDLVLPRSAPRGQWSAKVMIEGVDRPAGEMSFAVEDFAPQRLAVDADAQESRPVTPGETRAVNLTARFLYGAPGAGLQAQGEARISADPNPF